MRIFLECLVHTRLGSFNIPSKCGPLTFSILSWQDARASLEVGSAFLCSFGHLPAAASYSRVQSEHTCSGRSSCLTYALQLQAVIIFFKLPASRKTSSSSFRMLSLYQPYKPRMASWRCCSARRATASGRSGRMRRTCT